MSSSGQIPSLYDIGEMVFDNRIPQAIKDLNKKLELSELFLNLYYKNFRPRIALGYVRSYNNGIKFTIGELRKIQANKGLLTIDFKLGMHEAMADVEILSRIATQLVESLEKLK